MKVFLFVVSLTFILSACSGREVSSPAFTGSPYFDPDRLDKDEILHLPTGTLISREELYSLLQSSEIVYFGEGHDNIYDHRVELELIKEFWRRRAGQLAVGLEMLAAVNQDQIDQWLAGKLEDEDFLRLFAADWGLDDFVYYREIFSFIKDQQIPLRALNISRREKMAYMGGGGTPSQGSLHEKLSGIDDIYQEEALRAMFAGHAEGRGDLEIFMRIHQLWENTMAENIVNWLKSPAGEGKTLLVLSGAFHVAHGYGLPRRVFQRLRRPYAIVLTHTPSDLVENERRTMEVDFPGLPLYLGDFIWCVPYRNLKDVQARLGVGLRETPSGLEITKLEDDGAAAANGLLPGDLIVAVEGRESREVFTLKMLLLNKVKGDTIDLRIVRDGVEKVLAVRL
ncbi:MAG TPA: PDZ domain-containing protein [Proteobacteria bacterium]|mgnify:CR=1 FL=1|nr:PDZ domain-containing protein [Pseudomonadota bacterium]